MIVDDEEKCERNVNCEMWRKFVFFFGKVVVLRRKGKGKGKGEECGLFMNKKDGGTEKQKKNLLVASSLRSRLVALGDPLQTLAIRS